MLYMLISPAKKLATHTDYTGDTSSIQFAKQTETLVNILQKKTPSDLSQLMHLSEKLAYLNYTRYQVFTPTSYTAENSLPALFLFQGDVYQGLNADTFTKADLKFCQQSLGILSGLYGLLSPLDLIQPYRLEMGTALANPAGKNLVSFWTKAVTNAVNATLKANKATCLLNLASNEYFSVLDQSAIDKPIVKVDFKENKAGQLKTIGIHAKRARGTMVNFVVKHRCKTLADLQQFDGMGYQFDAGLSSVDTLVFVR